MIFVAAWATLALALAFSRSITLLVGMVVVAGVFQGPLLALTHDTVFQLVDDIPAVCLIGSALLRGLSTRKFFAPRASGLYLSVVALSSIAVVRSPDLGLGVTQARQVLIPLGLAYAGYVFVELIDWKRLLRACVVLALGVAAWMLVEESLQRPLVDPVWYYVQAIGGAEDTLRNGIPPAYYADGVMGDVTFRPGGPLLNPPTAGFFVALGAFAVTRVTRGLLRVVLLAVLLAALFFAYARAGLVIFVCAVVLYWVWHRLGRLSAVVVAVVSGVYVAQIFLEQGGTASHSQGLVDGTAAGISTVFGLGFGTTGYQAALESESGTVGESLLGLYFAWLGIPLILLVVGYVVALARRLVASPRKDTGLLWLCIGMLAAIAVSETGSALAGTAVLWMMLGVALKKGRSPLLARVEREVASVS